MIESLHEGEELVRRILDAVPGGVVHVARDGSILTANTDALRILGFRYDDVTKRYIVDWEPETIFEDGTPCPASEYPVAKVLATGASAGPTTIGVRRPDGAVVWAIFRAEPVLDPAGAVSGAVVTFLEITERKQAEEELRRSEQKWRSLGEHLPAFVVIADPDMTMLSVNRHTRPLTDADVLGKSLTIFLEAGVIAEYTRLFQSVIDTAKPARFETRGLAADGSGGMAWYETAFVPLQDGEKVTRVLVVAQDITERRAILASLAEKERLASVGMLAASVAHEIMNPLTYVLANLDFALSPRCPDEERRNKSLAAAREGAARMQQIVFDLRSLGRAGGEDLFYVDAKAVIETALRLTGPEVAQRAEVTLDLVEVPSVLASESRLCQVVINLLVNAAQAIGSDDHASDRRGEIRVRTRSDESANMVGIEISDTGEGIAPASLPRIFDPFFTTKRAGTGLGLSICRDIVERMGGRIDVTSTLGDGSTFTVWLSTMRVAS